MKLHPPVALIVCTVICLVFSAASPAQELEIAKGLKGSVEHGIYISPDKDFEIRIPSLLGGHVRDERAKESSPVASEVIFTDDFGQFYSVVSLRPSETLTTDFIVEHAFHDIREKKLTQTSRGREWRVINVEKHGAEIFEIDSKGNKSQPDLVTASAVFVGDNERIYHVTVGWPVSSALSAATGVTAEQRQEQLPKDLDEFLGGFKALKSR